MRTSKQQTATPSRPQVLQFLCECKHPATLQQLRAHFKLDARELRALTQRLGRMCAAGVLLQDRKGRYALPASMDIVAGRVIGHANGYGFVIPDDASGDLFLHHREMRKVLHGDRVLARLKKIDARGRKEGAVVEVMVEPDREIVGRFYFESGIGFVEPDDKRFGRDLTIPADARGRAEVGDIVVAKVTGHPVEHHHALGEIVEVIGKKLQAGMETKIAIRKHGIPEDWPNDAQAQAKKIPPPAPDRARRDLRDLHLLTIDGEDARDFDDAVYCAPLSKDGARGWRLLVAIADVSHYVRAGDALDREALRRGNSVYFPNLVVPMLPANLSDGICSLRPDEDRYCMVCDMKINARGKVESYEFSAALMRSHARLTYEIVAGILEQKDAALRKTWERELPHLENLHALSEVLLAARKRRGGIDFEFPEAAIEFDRNQKIRRIRKRERNLAHRLIEECMLAANVCAAEFLQARLGSHAIYRNHFGPSPESLADLRKFLSGLGAQLGGGDEPTAADYSKLVAKVSAQPEIAPVVQTALLRSLSQAVYATEQAGHFALAYPIYTHFTSPIRRYADLVVHRQIRALLARRDAAFPKLQKVAEQCSFTERRADDATRDVIARLKAEFMRDKIGEEFDGVISAVVSFGVFVQLDDLFIDGLVHVTALGDDYFHFDPLRFEIAGERGGRRFRLGQRLRVVVVQVNPDEAKIDFELCESGDSIRKKHRGKKRRASR